MFNKAKNAFDNNTKEANDWKTFMIHINKASVVVTPWY